MPPADPSDAGTSSRRPDSIAPRRSLSSSAGTPGPTSWTGSASAWPSPGDSSRARPVPWPSWGSGDEEGRGHRRGDDPLPPAVAGDRQRDVLRGHEDGPRFRGPHPGGRGHGRERDRAGRLRRRHMKGEYLADGCGGYRKPYTRVFTGGGTGVFSTIAGWWHVASGLAD